MAQPYVEYVDLKHDLIRRGRQLRADYEVPPSEKVDFTIKPVDATAAESLRADAQAIGLLLKAGSLAVDTEFVPPKAMPSALNALGTIYLSLGSLDVEAERAKLQGQLDAVTQELERIDQRLSNVDFVKKAKLDVVHKTMARQQELKEKGEKLAALIAALG